MTLSHDLSPDNKQQFSLCISRCSKPAAATEPEYADVSLLLEKGVCHKHLKQHQSHILLFIHRSGRGIYQCIVIEFVLRSSSLSPLSDTEIITETGHGHNYHFSLIDHRLAVSPLLERGVCPKNLNQSTLYVVLLTITPMFF